MKWMIFLFAFYLMIRPIMPFISYAVNYEYVSTELCENKDKPEMECNGKCHLKKELAKEIQEKNPVSESKKVNFAEVSLLFCAELKSFNFEKNVFDEEVQNLTSYSNLYQKEDLFAIFHPPTSLS